MSFGEEKAQDVLRLVAMVSDTSVKNLNIQGNISLLPGIPPLPKASSELWAAWPNSSSEDHKMDGHVATLLDGDRPVRVFAVIDQDHPLYAQNSSYDVSSLGKPNDDTWYITPPSLGGQSIPWNMRPAHNNNKGKIFGNLMFSRYVELMIHLWLDGMPPGSAFVKYEVSLHYTNKEYPERPNNFIYIIQFCAFPSAPPTNNIFSAMKEMADGLKGYAEKNIVELELMYNLPADWNIKKPTEFIKVKGTYNKDKVEYVHISSLSDFLTGKDISGGVPAQGQPDFSNKSKTVIKLGADGSITVEGHAISRFGLLEPIEQEDAIARSKYESWLFLRFMIKEWLNMTACTDPFVTFQTSQGNTEKFSFTSQFLATTTSPESIFQQLQSTYCPKTAKGWCDYVDDFMKGSCSSDGRDRTPEFESQNSQSSADPGSPKSDSQNSADPENKNGASSSKIYDIFMDSVPIVGGVRECMRGYQDLNNENYKEGIIKICYGLHGIYIDVNTLGLTRIPAQGAKSLSKDFYIKFGALFAERAAINLLNSYGTE